MSGNNKTVEDGPLKNIQNSLTSKLSQKNEEVKYWLVKHFSKLLPNYFIWSNNHRRSGSAAFLQTLSALGNRYYKLVLRRDDTRCFYARCGQAKAHVYKTAHPCKCGLLGRCVCGHASGLVHGFWWALFGCTERDSVGFGTTLILCECVEGWPLCVFVCV